MRLGESRPLIYLITTGKATADSFPEESRNVLDIVRAAVECGIPLVQIREKHLTARLLFSLAKDAAAITRSNPTKLLVNDRADIAAAAGADGVHLTSRSLPVSVVRQAFGDEMLIGVSTHSLEEVTRAADGGADFAVFGPVFETPRMGAATHLPAVYRGGGFMSAASPPVCLTIAGLDPSGGAGVIADIKTFRAFGCFGTAAVTSLTFQNTAGVFGAEHVPAESVLRQAEPVFDDFSVAAVKTGMLPSAETVRAVAHLCVERERRGISGRSGRQVDLGLRSDRRRDFAGAGQRAFSDREARDAQYSRGRANNRRCDRVANGHRRRCSTDAWNGSPKRPY